MFLFSAPIQMSDNQVKKRRSEEGQPLEEGTSLDDLMRVNVRMLKTLELLVSIQSNAAKQRKLEWALAHACIGAFDYFEEDKSVRSSRARIEEIIISFIGNGGRFVSTGSMTPVATEGSKQQFRQRLHHQLSRILGVPCRMEKIGNEFEIWYG